MRLYRLIPFLLVALLPLQGCIVTSIQKYRAPRDRLFLSTGEVETGKILKMDSVEIRLRKPDFAERVFPKKMVDSIAGLNYRTRFVSVAAVGGELNYWSRLLLEKKSASGLGYQIRWGRMVMGRRSRYFQYSRFALEPFWVKKWSVGWNYYFLKPYFHKENWYAGARFDINKLQKNGLGYSNLALTTGGEYFIHQKIRVFGEASFLKNFSPAQPRPSWVFGAGVRVAFREHSVFYRKLNDRLR